MRNVLVSILLLSVAITLFADELILQPGPAGIDTRINSVQTTVNFGNNDAINVGTFTQNGTQNVYTLIQWDISALPGGVTITSASMAIYCFDFSGTASGNMQYLRITDAWNELSVTWDTQPGTSTDISATSSWPSVGGWAWVDVTQFVQGWYTGSISNYGIMIVPQGATPDCVAFLYSSDYSNPSARPTLTINYSDVAILSTSMGQIKALFE